YISYRLSCSLSSFLSPTLLFFDTVTPTSKIYTLSLHDALPILEKAIPSITALAKWELVVEELTLKKLPAACETCTGNLSLVKYGKNNTPFSAGIVLRTIFSNVL